MSCLNFGVLNQKAQFNNETLVTENYLVTNNRT